MEGTRAPLDRESFLVWLSAWTEEPPEDPNLKEQWSEVRRLGFRSSSVAVSAQAALGQAPSILLPPFPSCKLDSHAGAGILGRFR